MPQLAPMNWLILFIYFSTLLYFSAVKLFFLFKFGPALLDSEKEVSTKEPLLHI